MSRVEEKRFTQEAAQMTIDEAEILRQTLGDQGNKGKSLLNLHESPPSVQQSCSHESEQIKDISELSLDIKALFDQAACNQGFKGIDDLVKSTIQP